MNSKIVQLSVVIIFIIIAQSYAQKSNREIQGNHPIVVELFTSEGCSSCPPADNVLTNLQVEFPTIISIRYHVDYWDHLGRKDRFGHIDHTFRQYQYNRFFKEGMYTPQIIINGIVQLYGIDIGKARQTLLRLSFHKLPLYFDVVEKHIMDKKIVITTHNHGDLLFGDLIAVLTQKEAVGEITSGDNKGLKIIPINVVRTFTIQTLLEKNKLSIDIPDDIKPGDGNIIIYSQNRMTGYITGVLKLEY